MCYEGTCDGTPVGSPKDYDYDLDSDPEARYGEDVEEYDYMGSGCSASGRPITSGLLGLLSFLFN